MNSSLKIAIGSFFAAALIIKAAPSLAEPVQSENMAVVHTADLNLATDAGRRELDQRLVIAAGEVCGTVSDADLAGKNAQRQCRKDVLATARVRGDSLLASRSGEGILVAARR